MLLLLRTIASWNEQSSVAGETNESAATWYGDWQVTSRLSKMAPNCEVWALQNGWLLVLALRDRWLAW